VSRALSLSDVQFIRTPRYVSAVIATNERGVCVGTDPTMFDAFDGEPALAALNHCAACPVTAECLEVVRPRHSWFTGVCGGHVWREGRERA
jgi:hypothetical protein